MRQAKCSVKPAIKPVSKLKKKCFFMEMNDFNDLENDW